VILRSNGSLGNSRGKFPNAVKGKTCKERRRRRRRRRRTSLDRQKFSGYSSTITTNLNPEDGGSTTSETLVSIHLTTRRRNPENHDF
jgi:hypothetical protein